MVHLVGASAVQTFHGHRDVDNQAVGFPVVGESAAKLLRDDPARERAAKSFAVRRPVERRPATFLPSQQKLESFRRHPKSIAMQLQKQFWQRMQHTD